MIYGISVCRLHGFDPDANAELFDLKWEGDDTDLQ